MRESINEQDEFLLGELLDGNLPEAEAQALRERLEREPALRSAYDEIRRLNDLLTARRADQPVVDWDRFHRQVMEAVDAEPVAAPSVIRFPMWARVAVPLAAAAAVALVVTLYDPGTQEVVVEYVQPGEPTSAGDCTFVYNRPGAVPAPASDGTDVYVELAKSDVGPGPAGESWSPASESDDIEVAFTRRKGADRLIDRHLDATPGNIVLRGLPRKSGLDSDGINVIVEANGFSAL
jgi:hypothetical protein